ncbi:Conserved oligomeric Golgi complex subunit 2 [Linum perenne]
MADPILTQPPPRSATDLFSEPIDGHPLWFKPNLFLSPNFDTESFISDLRTFVPFDTLRSELQSHLASLNHELIDLINRDYTDFVNLSTKLVDVDAAVVRMRAPLLELRKRTRFACFSQKWIEAEIGSCCCSRSLGTTVGYFPRCFEEFFEQWHICATN